MLGRHGVDRSAQFRGDRDCNLFAEMTWIEYAEHLEANLLDLHARVHTGAYRALPSLRKYIPKADGRQRPLGIAAMEDKIVQAAVVAILTPIYESEFLGFSYGFRPKRNQHQALDALAFGSGSGGSTGCSIATSNPFSTRSAGNG